MSYDMDGDVVVYKCDNYNCNRKHTKKVNVNVPEWSPLRNTVAIMNLPKGWVLRGNKQYCCRNHICERNG